MHMGNLQVAQILFGEYPTLKVYIQYNHAAYHRNARHCAAAEPPYSIVDGG
jgi:hypothetical protein